jgi:hypothetical protein
MARLARQIGDEIHSTEIVTIDRYAASIHLGSGSTLARSEPDCARSSARGS